MKKVGILLISLLFLNILALSLVLAQEVPPGLPPELGQDPEELIEKAKNKTQTSAEYLKQEWDEIIKDNPALSAFFKVADPILKAFTGYEFSMERAFFIALILSLIVFTFVWEGTDLWWGERIGSLAIAILFMIILSAAEFQRNIVPKIEILIDNRWKFILLIVIGLIIIALIEYLRRVIKKYRKEKALERLPKTEDKIEEAAGRLKGVTKGMEDVKKGYEKGAGI